MRSFNEHTLNTVSSCLASLCQINRLKTLDNVVYALVFSELFYCSSVWSSKIKEEHIQTENCPEFCSNSCHMFKTHNPSPEGLNPRRHKPKKVTQRREGGGCQSGPSPLLLTPFIRLTRYLAHIMSVLCTFN